MMDRKPMIAAALALLLPAKSLMAWAMMPEVSTSRLCAAETPFVAATAAMPRLVPVAFVAVSAIEPETGAAIIEQQREVVTSLLLETGCGQAEAQQQTAQLTAEDLAVLAANPRMVQKAGEMDELTKNVIWALVIAGVIVALVAAADGSIIIS